jgi:hypothetical protein
LNEESCEQELKIKDNDGKEIAGGGKMTIMGSLKESGEANSTVSFIPKIQLGKAIK